MTKIIVEHTRRIPKVKLHVFVDEAKVGNLKYGRPVEVDVPAGDHLLHIGFSPRKKDGADIPLHVKQGEAKRITTDLTFFTMLAARWHLFLLYLPFFFGGMAVARWILKGVAQQSHITLAIYLLPVSILIYFLVEMKRKNNPKNYIDIKV